MNIGNLLGLRRRRRRRNREPGRSPRGAKRESQSINLASTGRSPAPASSDIAACMPTQEKKTNIKRPVQRARSLDYLLARWKTLMLERRVLPAKTVTCQRLQQRSSRKSLMNQRPLRWVERNHATCGIHSLIPSILPRSSPTVFSFLHLIGYQSRTACWYNSRASLQRDARTHPLSEVCRSAQCYRTYRLVVQANGEFCVS